MEEYPDIIHKELDDREHFNAELRRCLRIQRDRLLSKIMENDLAEKLADPECEECEGLGTVRDFDDWEGCRKDYPCTCLVGDVDKEITVKLPKAPEGMWESVQDSHRWVWAASEDRGGFYGPYSANKDNIRWFSSFLRPVSFGFQYAQDDASALPPELYPSWEGPVDEDDPLWCLEAIIKRP